MTTGFGDLDVVLGGGILPGDLAAIRAAAAEDVFSRSKIDGFSFDVEVDAPYALVFYRGADRAILDALYTPVVLLGQQSENALKVGRFLDPVIAVSDKAGGYKDTLNLPKTSFNMKANLVQNEPATLKRWQQAKLYEQVRAASKGRPRYVFHDGPPYANGSIHLYLSAPPPQRD